MVLCKIGTDEVWNAFGFFGGGNTGKSSLSFIVGRLLVERDGFVLEKERLLKVIDDNFRFENGLVSSDDWGGDKSGKCREFKECIARLGHSYVEAKPDRQTFRLGSFIGWFLTCNNVPTPVIVRSNRDEYVSKLLTSNPCHSKTPQHPTSPSQDKIDASPEIRNKIHSAFAPSWEYFLVTRMSTNSPEDNPMLENLALRAYDLWHHMVFRNATQNGENRRVL